MAIKNGFSKGWHSFVDHKWSKKVLARHSLSNTLPRSRVCERLFPKVSGRYRRLSAKASIEAQLYSTPCDGRRVVGHESSGERMTSFFPLLTVAVIRNNAEW